MTARCSNCGATPRSAADVFCRSCGASLGSRPGESVTSQSSSEQVVLNRYRDGFRVARFVVGLGRTIKIVGWILVAVILLGSVISLATLGFRVAIGGVLLSGVLALGFWVCGVMVSAQGQVLQATLDTAVATSPFLTNPGRAEAMGVAESIANRDAA